MVSRLNCGAMNLFFCAQLMDLASSVEVADLASSVEVADTSCKGHVTAIVQKYYDQMDAARHMFYIDKEEYKAMDKKTMEYFYEAVKSCQNDKKCCWKLDRHRTGRENFIESC